MKYIKKIFNKITSTQIYAKQFAYQDYPHGTLILAKQQTQGYGTHGRNWSSALGGLWGSLILDCQTSYQRKSSFITFACSVAIVQTIYAITQRKNIPIYVKWPNDIVIYEQHQNPSYRKVSGILTEIFDSKNHVKKMVIGFGININNDIPTALHSSSISLKNYFQCIIDEEKFLEKFLEKFSIFSKKIDQFRWNEIKLIYEKYLVFKKGDKICLQQKESDNKTFIFSQIGYLGELIVKNNEQYQQIFSGHIDLNR